MPRPVTIGAVLPVAGNRYINQPRVDTAHVLETGAQGRKLSGAEPFNDDIGAFRQIAKPRQPLGGLQVERNAAFAAVQGPKQRRKLTGRIADIRSFDHDHLGAHVRQQHRRIGTRELFGKAEDFQAGQGCSAHIGLHVSFFPRAGPVHSNSIRRKKQARIENSYCSSGG